jgi:hypothetical protein
MKEIRGYGSDMDQQQVSKTQSQAAAALIETLRQLVRPENDVTVGQLQLWDKIVDLDVRTGDVEQQFLSDSALPGFIVHEERRIFGVLPRRTFFTVLSQPFGREVFIKRPLRELANKMEKRPLTVKGGTTISDALRQAMARPDEQRYDPLLVHTGQAVGLLEVHTLLIAQANQLEQALSSKARLLERIKAAVGDKL